MQLHRSACWEERLEVVNTLNCRLYVSRTNLDAPKPPNFVAKKLKLETPSQWAPLKIAQGIAVAGSVGGLVLHHGLRCRCSRGGRCRGNLRNPELRVLSLQIVDQAGGRQNNHR